MKIFISLDVEGVDVGTAEQFESLVKGAIVKEVKHLKENCLDAVVKTETSRIGKFTFSGKEGSEKC